MNSSQHQQRRQQLMDRFLEGDIDKETYDRLVAEVESLSQAGDTHSSAAPDRPTPHVSVGDHPTITGGKELAAGDKLGEFVLDRFLGRGGMGEVWLANDPVAERKVVVKVLPPQFVSNPSEAARVKATFKRVHALSHQHICPLYVLGEDPDHGYYVVMKYIDGRSLAEHQQERLAQDRPYALNEVADLLLPVARALDYAHQRRVVHRDIKPQNIMLDAEGGVYVVDFGLAADIRTSMTRISQVRMDASGTYPYMAPEQWKGQFQDGCTDQYALAVVAHELLAGRLPFEAPDDFVLRQCVLTEAVEPLQDQPAHVNSALAKALGKSRDDRFASCEAFVQALTGREAEVKQAPPERPKPPVAAPPAGPPPRSDRAPEKAASGQPPSFRSDQETAPPRGASGREQELAALRFTPGTGLAVTGTLNALGSLGMVVVFYLMILWSGYTGFRRDDDAYEFWAFSFMFSYYGLSMAIAIILAGVSLLRGESLRTVKVGNVLSYIPICSPFFFTRFGFGIGSALRPYGAERCFRPLSIRTAGVWLIVISAFNLAVNFVWFIGPAWTEWYFMLATLAGLGAGCVSLAAGIAMAKTGRCRVFGAIGAIMLMLPLIAPTVIVGVPAGIAVLAAINRPAHVEGGR